MSASLLRHDSDHLRVFFMIYAVFFAQGLIRMVEQVYSQPNLNSVVASASLALIGLRLIFSPEALSEYLLALRAAGQPAFPKAVTLWHYPVLLVQAWALFLTCYQLKFSGPEGPGPAIVWSAIATLAINTAWLSSQLLGATTAGVHFHQSRGPRPLFWMINNLVCVVLAGSALLFVPSGGILIALVILVANSLVALFGTAESYVPQAQNR
jgi:hypothetical protein